MRRRKPAAFTVLLVVATLLVRYAPAHAAEHIKVGISRLLGYPGVPIAIDRGYFAKQGLDVEMVFFDSAQPIAIAVASGDVQFGTAGMSASFYNLAGQGQLKLIASSAGGTSKEFWKDGAWPATTRFICSNARTPTRSPRSISSDSPVSANDPFRLSRWPQSSRT